MVRAGGARAFSTSTTRTEVGLDAFSSAYFFSHLRRMQRARFASEWRRRLMTEWRYRDALIDSIPPLLERLVRWVQDVLRRDP